ncbi:MAG: GntR family transcriptional regulator [Chthonomonadales bacterium]|nr:GntR family transcriptional regulator [Chthonomonadales bacterium]
MAAPLPYPRYQRIRRHIETQIRQGDIAVGERIPGERELAREYGVSQMTVNRAIQDLVRAGLLFRRVGAGTFVRSNGEDGGLTAAFPFVLVVPFTDHPEEDMYLSVPFRAICQAASEAERPLMVVQAPERDFARVVAERPEHGFIFVAPCSRSLDTLVTLSVSRVPFVVLGASWQEAPFACVDSDNAGGARDAADYLVSLGHERIAFLNAPDVSANCRDRLTGYRQALAARGLELDPDLVVEAATDRDLGEAARQRLIRLLTRAEPATAVLCAGYLLTLELWSLLWLLRLRVPADVSVIGFDDPPSAQHLTPPLTVVRQPLWAMGERAVERLRAITPAACRPPSARGPEHLPTELVLRGSCERRSRTTAAE